MSENEKITNAEYVINLLLDPLHDNGIELHNFDIDDGGASEEAMIYYNIACPYFVGDERAECKNNSPLKTATREQCFKCKYNWLTNEVDE
jgi:hypothetical protein